MPILSLTLWGSAILLTLLLLARMVISGQHREYRLFSLYLVINLLQSAVGVALYQGYGFTSRFAYPIAWTTQGIVVAARALSAAEVCYLVLGSYKGIWALAVRILSVSGALVLGLSLYFGRNGYQFGILTFEIGLEACIATGTAGMFLFARYYNLPILRVTGLLGLGLGLLSCCKILNDLVLARFATVYGGAWNYASSGAFLVILLMWTWAMLQPAEVRLAIPQLRSATEYAKLIPQVNQRLAELNEHLTQLWHAEWPKS
jgi:hypothetical protein